MERYWPSPPLDLKTAMTFIHWARMAAQKTHNTTTIIIINHKDDPLPITHAKIHMIATVPPNTI
jgi:hypothetical protein